MRVLPILCSLLILAPALSHAGVTKISGPLAVKGQFVGKHFYSRTFDNTTRRDGNSAFRGGYEYDFGENWVGEVGFNGANRYREDTRLKATTFEIMHTATRQSKGWWLSSGIIGGYALDTDSGKDKVLAKLRLQREEGALRLRLTPCLIVRREAMLKAISCSAPTLQRFTPSPRTLNQR